MKNNKLYSEKSMDKMMKVALMCVLIYNIYNASKTNTNENLIVMFVSVILLANFAPKRDYYLPFLGDAVIPTGLLVPHFPENANVSKRIRIKPRQKVVFWASEPSDNPKQMPWNAYKQYKNSGVAFSDEKGMVTLRVRKPSVYSKPWGFGDSVLKRHIHYRVVRTNGMLGRVETIYL